ncbi:hypothetical protein [Streptomyces sp. NPDC047841]
MVEIDGTGHRLSPYDTTYVAAGTPHRFNASRPPLCGSCGRTPR